MADEVKNGLSADSKRVPSKWTRNTVADGLWLQKYTLSPLTARDYYLASAIDSLGSATDGDISALSAAITYVSSTHDEYINNVSSTVNTLSSEVCSTSSFLLSEISSESSRAADAEFVLSNRIDNMEAATDVINVYGTHSAFESESGEMVEAGYLTDKDIIKVLEDETKSASQTYYQYSITGDEWTYIGALDPYYSKSDLKNAAGKNINITTDENDKIKINTTDNVEFSSVVSTDFSGTNISSDNKTATIENLITSAEGGSAANNWLDTNSKKYISAISSDDNVNIECTISTAYNGSATTAKLALSGYKTYFSTNEFVESVGTQSDYTFQYQLTDKAISYMNQGHEASAWIISGDYVKHIETGLKIGDIASLDTVNAATALGKNAMAANDSYIINFGENSQLASYATNKGFAVGDSNYAVYNSYVIGLGNSADNLGDSTNQNRFILGLSNSSNASNTFTIGLQNKTSMNNSFIMGIGNNLSNNTTLPYKIILGSYSQSTAQTNINLFAIGNGTSTKSKDLFTLSNNNLIYNTLDNYKTLINSAGIQFTIPDGTTNPPIAKTIPNKYIQGLSFLEPEYCNSAAADINGDICLIFGDNASAGAAPTTGGNFTANRISLYFDTSCKSKRFRLYPTIASAYSLCIGLNSNIKDIYIRGFGPMRYPGDGVDPITGAALDNVYFIASSWDNIGWPGLRPGYAPSTTGATAIQTDNYYYNATQSTYLYIRRIALNRYIDITYDRLANAFVMIKGFESSKLCYPTTD